MKNVRMTSVFNSFSTGLSSLFCGEQISFQLQDARYENLVLSIFNWHPGANADKVLLFLMNMREYMETQWRAPKFLYFITRAVRPLLSGASVQFRLLPQRESEMRKVSWLTLPGGGALSPARLAFSDYLVNNCPFNSPSLPWMFQINGTPVHFKENYFAVSPY